jgi:hypothetical protein
MFNGFRTTTASLILGLGINASAIAQTPEPPSEVLKRMRDRRDQEAKKVEAENAALKAAQQKDKEATPPPPKPQVFGTLTVQSAPDSLGTIKDLTQSKDRKIAAAAKELLDLLVKAKPPGVTPPNPPKPDPKATPKGVELKIEGLTFVLDIGSESSLKLSFDGKTAAVIGTDGSVTVYDVATGKEVMKFPAKK